MENQPQEEIQDNGLTISQEVELSGMISMVKALLPNIGQYVPTIESYIDQGQAMADDYLGDNEKIIVAFRSKGVSKVIVIDAKGNFNISHNKETGKKEFYADKIIEDYGVRKFINEKLLANPKLKYVLNDLRSDYERNYKGQEAPDLPSFKMVR